MARKIITLTLFFFTFRADIYPEKATFIPSQKQQLTYLQLASADFLVPGFGAIYYNRPGWAVFYATAKLGSIYLAYAAVNNYSYWNSLNIAAQSRQSTELAPLRYQAADGKNYTSTQIFNKKNESIVQISIASILLTVVYSSSIIHNYAWHDQAENEAAGMYQISVNQEGKETKLAVSYYY
jgi:hypothetical protein